MKSMHRIRLSKLMIMIAASVTILFVFGQTGSAAVIQCPTTTTRCNGTEADDIMKGNDGNNDMFGLGGNDRMTGSGGFLDELFGGEGNDILNGGKGQNALVGENGTDKLIGGNERDLMNGGLGADSFKCGAAINDQIEDFNPGEGDTKSNDCEIF